MATAFKRSGSATELPPNFITSSPTEAGSAVGRNFAVFVVIDDSVGSSRGPLAALPRPIVSSALAIVVRTRRRLRLLALLAARNELRYLQGYVANVSPHVDGIIALDDGSTDGTLEFLRGCASVLELVEIPADRPRWDEVGNYRRLLEAALRHGPAWAIALDADDRVERHFRRRAEAVIRRGRWLGRKAYAVKVREVWDAPDQYRADGIWGQKWQSRLFELRDDHVVDDSELHAQKAPLQFRNRHDDYPLADLELYHLRMLTAESREARRRRYEELDPSSRWQPEEGYAYLTDETGLRVDRIRPDRMYVE